MRFLWWLTLVALDIAFIIMVIIFGFPFTEETMQIILFVVSLNVGFIGILLGLEARSISQNRHTAINKYERPHIIRTMDILLSDISETISNMKQYDQTDKPGALTIVEYVHMRAQWHMETIRLLTPQFLDIGLSEHHVHLESVLVDLGIIGFPGKSFDMGELVDIFDMVMDSVFQVREDMTNSPDL